jgi:hypothetical protein
MRWQSGVPGEDRVSRCFRSIACPVGWEEEVYERLARWGPSQDPPVNCLVVKAIVQHAQHERGRELDLARCGTTKLLRPIFSHRSGCGISRRTRMDPG